MQTTILTITPETAEQMIARSAEVGGLNRLTKSKVTRLLQQLKGGLWRLNGEGIIISLSGKILDGHHRLQACILSKVSFETLLVTEAPEDILDTLDTGSSRSIADTLHLSGHVGKPSLLSPLGKAVGYIINNQREGHPLKHAQPPACEISQWLNAHAELEKKCLGIIERTFKVLPAAPKPLIAYCYLEGMLSADPNDIEKFFERVITGFGITAGDPAGAMRELFLVEVPAKNKSKRPLGNVDLCARILKAINASIHGETVQKLTFSRKEEFPIINAPHLFAPAKVVPIAKPEPEPDEEVSPEPTKSEENRPETGTLAAKSTNDDDEQK